MPFGSQDRSNDAVCRVGFGDERRWMAEFSQDICRERTDGRQARFAECIAKETNQAASNGGAGNGYPIDTAGSE
jgi:hypothetical protein